MIPFRFCKIILRFLFLLKFGILNKLYIYTVKNTVFCSFRMERGDEPLSFCLLFYKIYLDNCKVLFFNSKKILDWFYTKKGDPYAGKFQSL